MKCYIDRIYSRDKIEVKDNLVEYYTTNKKKTVIKLECDIETKEMKTSQSKDNVHFVSFSDEEICRNDRIVISDDGSRWEGDVFNQQPFGFGSFYDGEGNRIYSGFMFEGKKIGYGEEFFSDNHKVDYCGNFMNDKRHGWGVSYDRNNIKLYEGEWGYGMNNFSSCVIKKNENDFGLINLNVYELIIQANCFDNYNNAFVIENNDLLQYISIGENSFPKAKSFIVRNCKNLMEMNINDYVFGCAEDVLIDSIIKSN